jgi:hypothetical protein
MQQFEVGLESLIDPELVKLSIEDAGRDVEHMHCTLSVLIIFSSAFLLLANLMAPWRDLFSLPGRESNRCLWTFFKFKILSGGRGTTLYFILPCSKAI